MNVQERLQARRKILDQVDQDEWHSLTRAEKQAHGNGRARRKRRRDMQKASRRRNR
jgi:hypothetical protein